MPQQRLKVNAIQFLIAAAVVLILGFHLWLAFGERSMIRASHLGTALAYAQGPIDLLRPVIVGFNATGTPTALEFPLWQAIAGLTFKITHSTWYGWANLVSLGLFLTSLWPFLQLARNYVGERAAWWGLLFFLSQPLIVANSGTAATDGFCLTITLWFLYFVDQFVRGEGTLLWWALALIFACLSAVLKLPFFVVAGLCAVGILCGHEIRRPKPWLMLIGIGAISGFVFLLWSSHCDRLASQAEYPFTELRLSQSPWLQQWYFGDLALRLKPGIWAKGIWRFLHGTLGALPLIGLVFIAWRHARARLFKLWLGSFLLVTLVFSNLILAHWHYYLICCPAIAMLCGLALARLEETALLNHVPAGLCHGTVAVLLFLSTVDGLTVMKVGLDYDPFTAEMSDVIRTHTSPGDRLLIKDHHLIWGGEVLFRANRKGLVVSSFKGSTNTPSKYGLLDLLENDADLNRLRALGYNKLVLISESPLQASIITTSMSGGAAKRRALYPEHISPKVDAWQTVYQSDDILIKIIPR